MCDKLAGTLKRIKSEYKDKVAIVINYCYDTFQTQETKSREAYYDVGYWPTCYGDGILNEPYKYDKIKANVERRLAEPSPLAITMGSTCPQNEGTLQVTLTNTSQSSVNGTLHVVVIENKIPHSWSNQPSTEDCNRDMLPDAKGESITLAAGENITKQRTFTIKSNWKKQNCRLIAFLQKSNKEIIQGKEIGINEGTHCIQPQSTQTMNITVKSLKGSLYMQSPCLGDHKVSLINLQGQSIKTTRINSSQKWNSIPVEVAPGLYIIKVITNKYHYSQPIMLTR